MDLKSSSLEVSAQQASAVQNLTSVVRLSSVPILSPRIFRLHLFIRAAVCLFAGLLMAPIGHGQQPDEAPGRAATQTEMSVSATEGPVRTRASFSVQVKVARSGVDEASATPTGSVSFMDGERSIGAALLDSDGRATLTVDALPAGFRQITAVYEGDSGHLASASRPAVVHSEASGAQGFTLSAAPTSLSVAAGDTVSTVVTATPENGFNQAVSLSCSGVPYVSVTCSFSPSPVTPGPITSTAPNGTPAVSTLTIATQAPSGAQLQPPGNGLTPGIETAYALMVPGVLALAGLGLTRKRNILGKYSAAARMMGLLALLAAGSLGLGACSQRYKYFHRPPAGNPGTPVGAYTVTISGITGTGSSLFTGSVNVTLKVTAN
jgi:hypothetical protein